ncbi:putative tubulin--tyrosine ligase [Podosphaera aphanis]|nr:putative tubulin--tyrosine ligase [Podosphaera aphanis]
MHILVVNDDGPPSNQSSPYVHSFVKALQTAGNVVSVVLPHTQRSWIGKAHMVGQTVKPTYFRPGTLHTDDGTTHSRPLPPGSEEQEEWILVDGTPASCVQIGLYHFFHDRGPVDLVVSGPNYGRNSTAVFSLSSGTLGGALEGAVCKRRSIALSYAFFSRNHDPTIIAGAVNLSVRLIEFLHKNWNASVDLYSINIPLIENVGEKKIYWTNILQNYWVEGSCFEEVKDDEKKSKDIIISDLESTEAKDESNITRHQHKLFKWAPRFTDVYQSVTLAPPGNDGWAVQQGYTSVTPLKANFMHAPAQIEGELKLSTPSLPNAKYSSCHRAPKPHFYALINYGDAYLQPLILASLNKSLPEESYCVIENLLALPNPTDRFLQIGAYESLYFEHILKHAKTSLVNSYVIRKSLIRKHYLCSTAYNWIVKNPSSILKSHMKPSCHFELDYAEFLDDAIVDAWELKEAFENNQNKTADERAWWILKPGMSDQGQGIRLFSSEDELLAIFEGWEAQQSDPDDENEDLSPSDLSATNSGKETEYIVTSHLRHFVAQPYIHPPFLIDGNPRKFHIRTYVLALGNLKVFVYKDMLALFSATNYIPPWSSTCSTDLSAHLTNTCRQKGSDAGAVKLFSALNLSPAMKESILSQICNTTGEIFEAAARGMMLHFQTLPNAFEVFGLDFLLDESGTAWLLEVNAFPDFKQTGEELKDVVGVLWEAIIGTAVAGFFGLEKSHQCEAACEKMILVKEIKLSS